MPNWGHDKIAFEQDQAVFTAQKSQNVRNKPLPCATTGIVKAACTC